MDFTADIHIKASVQFDGDGSAQYVNLTIKGAVLQDSILDELIKQVASDANLCDAEDIDVVGRLGLSNNIQELVKKHSGFKFGVDEMITSYKAEVAFHNDEDED